MDTGRNRRDHRAGLWPGYCTHYIKDANYDEEKEKKMLARVKEQKRRYSEKKRVFSLRPVGRPRKSEQER